jgi:hypothetical protein
MWYWLLRRIKHNGITTAMSTAKKTLWSDLLLITKDNIIALEAKSAGISKPTNNILDRGYLQPLSERFIEGVLGDLGKEFIESDIVEDLLNNRRSVARNVEGFSQAALNSGRGRVLHASSQNVRNMVFVERAEQETSPFFA